MAKSKKILVFVVTMLAVTLCLNLTGLAASTTIFDKGADNWYVYITTDPFENLDWATSMNADGWQNVKAPFGYATKDASNMKPLLENGGTYLDMDASNNPLYAKKAFNIDDISKVTDILYKIEVDDAVRLYINGVQIASHNFTSGNETETVSDDAAKFSGSAGVPDIKTILKNGENILAAEIWNISNTSSDLFLDVSLEYTEDDVSAETSAEAVPTAAANAPSAPRTGDALQISIFAVLLAAGAAFIASRKRNSAKI